MEAASSKEGASHAGLPQAAEVNPALTESEKVARKESGLQVEKLAKMQKQQKDFDLFHASSLLQRSAFGLTAPAAVKTSEIIGLFDLRKRARDLCKGITTSSSANTSKGVDVGDLIPCADSGCTPAKKHCSETQGSSSASHITTLTISH